MRRIMDQRSLDDPQAFERANYIKTCRGTGRKRGAIWAAVYAAAIGAAFTISREKISTRSRPLCLAA